jgi:putative lipoprotein (rSAM/lipoprotein system)
MKTKFLKVYNKLLYYIIALLGVGTSFTTSCAMYGTPVEYGVPNATFKVSGKVTTEQNIAIPNIRVVLPYDTAYTDNQGNYLVKTVTLPGNQSIPIQFKDIDNAQNGEFKNLDTIAKFVNPQFTGGDGHWNQGETEIELNIKLKPLK